MPLQLYATPAYAALLALLYFVLSLRVIRLRRRFRIALGDAGNPEMTRAIRVHSNFAEYAPLTLLLIFMLEASAAHAALVHALALALLAGRIAHAWGVARHPENFRFRVLGMVLTFTALAGAAAGLLALYAWTMFA